MSTPTEDESAFLHELEGEVKTELTEAETSYPTEDADGVPTDEWLMDPRRRLRHRRRTSRRPRHGAGTDGGRIVAETLIGLLRADPTSYLSVQPDWRPTLTGTASSPCPIRSNTGSSGTCSPTLA